MDMTYRSLKWKLGIRFHASRRLEYPLGGYFHQVVNFLNRMWKKLGFI